MISLIVTHIDWDARIVFASTGQEGNSEQYWLRFTTEPVPELLRPGDQISVEIHDEEIEGDIHSASVISISVFSEAA